MESHRSQRTILFPSSFNFRRHPSAPISYHDVGFPHSWIPTSKRIPLPRSIRARYPRSFRHPLRDFPGDNQALATSPVTTLCGGIAKSRCGREERCGRDVGGANLRQQQQYRVSSNRLHPLETPADAHTRSICAHLPTPVSHTLVASCSSGAGLVQGHFRCSQNPFFEHLVILLVVLLVLSQ